MDFALQKHRRKSFLFRNLAFSPDPTTFTGEPREPARPTLELFSPKSGVDMQAQDILDTTHQLEEKGMTRPQAETVSKALAAAVEPLATKENLTVFATKEDLTAFATKEDLKAFATKEDLKAFATKEDLKAFATKQELADAIRPLATREELASEIKTLREKDLKGLEERLSRDIAIMFEKTNTRIESVKVWLLGGLLTGLLAIALSIVVYSFQVAAAAPRVERELDTGQFSEQPPETLQRAY